MTPKKDLWIPPELILQILTYTDLVTPNSKVCWSPEQNYHLPGGTIQNCETAYHEGNCEPPYDTCIPSRHQNCSSLLHPKHYEHRKRCYPEAVPPSPESQDFCECPHGGYWRKKWFYTENNNLRSSCWRCPHWACQFLPPRHLHHSHPWPKADTPGSSTGDNQQSDDTMESCKWWKPPTALFLVSKAFRELALQVFLSENELEVQPTLWPQGDYFATQGSGDAPSPEAALFDNLTGNDWMARSMKRLSVTGAMVKKAPGDPLFVSANSTWRTWLKKLEQLHEVWQLESLSIEAQDSGFEETKRWIPRNETPKPHHWAFLMTNKTAFFEYVRQLVARECFSPLRSGPSHVVKRVRNLGEHHH